MPNSITLPDQVRLLEDTPLPLSEVSRTGYYSVGEKLYIHKILALQEATRSHLPIQWHFQDKEYGAQNWRVSNNLGLKEMYRLRAQQLRNKYKYIMLLWSGGGDSTTMIHAFCANNIHVDEVLICWPITLQDGVAKIDPTDISSTNMPSEWEFSIKPLMERLKKQYPKLKITVHDTGLNKFEDADDTVLIAEKHSYMGIQRWRSVDYEVRTRMEQLGHDDVVCVWGVSPVEITLLDDWVAVQFSDLFLGAGVRNDITIEGWRRKVEYFYWTPDMPEIPREQAHTLMRDLNINPEMKKAVLQLKMQPDRTFKPVENQIDGTMRGELNRRWKKSLFYDLYPLDNFQVIKQYDTHWDAPWEQWIGRHPHAQEVYAPYRSAVKAHQALIDPKFFRIVNGHVASYQHCYSPWYMIGRLNPEPIIMPK